MERDVLIRMRDRVNRLRRIAALAHNPEMIGMLLKLAEEGEADIKQLEAQTRRSGEA